MLIKDEKYNEIRYDLQVLSETLIRQCALSEDLLINGWKDLNYVEFLKNEENINFLNEIMLQKLSIIVIQFSPKGKDLRKIVYTREVIIRIELLGNDLNTVVGIIKEADIKSSDYNVYKTALIQFFNLAQKMIQEACYSFYNEDLSLAYRIIHPSKQEDMKELKKSAIDVLLSDFEQIPLEKQELVNIMAFDKAFHFVEKITEIAIGIAKSTIFAIQGNREIFTS
jgi:Phosphate uptake regulator